MSIDSVPASPSTNSLAVDGSVSGTIDIGGDQDWYRVSLVAGRQYRFDLRGLDSAQGTLGDPVLRLLDPSQLQVAFDDDSGFGLESSITFTAAAAGDHFLSAQGYASFISSSTGSFALSATDLTGSAGDVPGGIGTGSSVAIGGAAATGTIDFAGDQDWYRVELVAGHQYRFDLTGTSLVDPVLRLLDAAGAQIAFNDDSAGTRDSSIAFTATSSGTYFVSAQAVSSHLGAFALTAADLTSTGAGDVPGSIATASTLDVGASLTGTIDSSGDQDWYRITLVPGNQYRVDLHGFDAGQGTLADPYLRVLDATGAQIDFNDDFGLARDSSIFFTAISDTYLLSAQGFLSSAGTFRLSVLDFGPAVGDVPVGTGTSGSVSVGGSVFGTVDSAGDDDWYRVELLAEHHYRFDLVGGSLVDPVLRLFDSSGANQLALNDDSGGGLDSSIAFTAAASGTYFLSAEGFSSNSGSFTLSAAESTGGSGDVPAAAGTASAIAPGGSLAGTIDAAGDQDWYRISLEAGHQYQFDLRGADSGQGTLADAYLQVLNASGLPLADNDNFGLSRDSRIEYTAPSSGSYLLAARGFGANTGSFTLEMRDVSHGSADVANSTATTGALFIGGSVAGTLGAGSDQDWYRVSLVEGREYVFDLQGFDSGRGDLTDPYLRLLDGSGVEIVANDDEGVGLESSISHQASTTGTYYLSAESYDGFSSGRFLLSATDVTVDVAGGTGTRSVTVMNGDLLGLIGAGGDQDWYQVTLTAGHRYAFDLQGSSSGQGTLADPLLRLLDTSGNEILLDDDSGSGRDASIVLTATESSTFYLSAQGYSGSTGSFELSAVDFDDPGDIAEGVATPSSLAVGGAIAGTIEASGDQDWYRIPMVAGHRYRFDVQGADSGNGSLADPLVRLIRDSGVEFIRNDDSFGTNDSVITLGSVNDLTMFVSVEGSGSSTGTYTVKAIDLTAVSPDVPASISTTSAVVPSHYSFGDMSGGSITGLVNGNSGTFDDDWYRVELVGGRDYLFDVLGAASGQGTLSDPYLELRSSSGALLASDSDGPSTNEPFLTHRIDTTGTYYLAVGGQTPTDVGSFRVSVTDLSTPVDVGSTLGTAAVAFPHNTIMGSIDGSGDQDWYRITLTAGRLYEFAQQGSPSNFGTLADPHLRLLDASGALVVEDNDSGFGADANFLYAPTQSGDYFLSAQGFDSSSGTFILGIADLTVGSAEVLDTRATSSVVAVGGAVLGSIDTAGDRDWYQVMLVGGQPYRFDLRGVESEKGTLVDPYLVLYGDTGTSFWAWDDDSGAGLESSILFTPVSSGAYYLSAEANGVGAGTYELSVVQGDAVPASTGTSESLAAGSSITGRVDTIGDHDWYRVELLAGHEYQFDLRAFDSAHGSLSDPFLRLLDSAGQEILSHDDLVQGIEREARITYTATQSGVYFVSAEGFDTTLEVNTGSFTLNFVDLSAADVAANSNTPAFLASNGGIASGTIDAAGDQDWFELSLVQGRAYRFDMQGFTSPDGTPADAVLRLLDGAGGELLTSDFIGTVDESITFTAQSTGTHFLSAEGWASNTGTFVLTAAEISGGDVLDNTDTGSALGIGGSLTGSIGFAFDDDWYRVELVAEHQYRFDLVGAAPFDPYLRLLDNSGVELAFNDDSGATLDSSITFSATQSGTFFLSAAEYLDGTGTFTLSAVDLTGNVSTQVGTSSGDVLVGGELEDDLFGGGGADVLDGKAGDDFIDGESADDSLSGGLGADTVNGGAGNDVFLHSSVESVGNDRLSGGPGDDVFNDHFGHNVLDGGAGADLFNVYIADPAGTNLVSGGAGADTYRVLPRTTASSPDAYVVADFETGSEGDVLDLNALLEASAAERFYTAGSSVVSQFLRLLQSGADTLVQWDRNGPLDGSNWVTQLTLKNTDATKFVSANFAGTADIGTKSADQLVGTQGDDELFGAEGNDSLVGGAGADVLVGGRGADLYFVDDPKDSVVETDNLPSDSLSAKVGLDLGSIIDTVVASIDHVLANFVENLELAADAGNISGTGNTLANAIAGNEGGNTLASLEGDDIVRGGAGNDLLDGGAGVDTADYSAAASAVTAELWQGLASNDGQGGADTLMGIENLTGGGFSDLLAGDDTANNLSGAGGNDTFVGAGGNDSLAGEAGDDILRGGSGNDTLDGGDGVDTLDYSTVTNAVTVEVWKGTVSADGEGGADTLVGIENVFGTQANDLLVGTEDANSLFGNTGNDSILGGGGADLLLGEAGDDTLGGNAGNDTINGGDGIDTLDYSLVTNGVTVEVWLGTVSNDGNGGADTLVGIENVFGTQSNDLLVGTEDANRLFGNTGNDSILGGGGADSLLGEGGNDTLGGNAGNDTIDGGDGIDTVDYSLVASGVTVEVWLGTVSNDGNGGADTLVGIENVFGTQSNDLLVGTEDANRLFGNTGNDSILGGGGNDSLLGEGGNDTLGGNAGNDTIDGGDGIDTVDYSLVTNGVTVELWLGTVGNDGQGGADTIVGIENAFGTLANDFLVGTEDANALFGNSGNDTVSGGGGADSLFGEGGNDLLWSGTGNDTVSGGAGLDEYLFDTALGPTNIDQITDFSVADDTILLWNAIFTTFNNTGSLPAGTFVSGATVDANDFLIYDLTSGALSYDADGSGSGSPVQFATLIAAPALTAADFVVI